MGKRSFIPYGLKTKNGVIYKINVDDVNNLAVYLPEIFFDKWITRDWDGNWFYTVIKDNEDEDLFRSVLELYNAQDVIKDLRFAKLKRRFKMKKVNLRKKSDYMGWNNYYTWVVSVWLFNDMDTYYYMVDLMEEVNYDVYEFAEEIKEYIEENMPIVEASVYNDLLSAVLREEVNYKEIAEEFIRMVRENNE